MNLTHKAVGLLRVLLAVLFAASVLGQVLSWPGQFASMAQEEPDLAHLRWPLTAVAVLALLCVEVVIVCTWRLLTMVKVDRIFSRDAFAWVDGIVWADRRGLGPAARRLGGGRGGDLRDPRLRDPVCRSCWAGWCWSAASASCSCWSCGRCCGRPPSCGPTWTR